MNEYKLSPSDAASLKIIFSNRKIISDLNFILPLPKTEIKLRQK